MPQPITSELLTRLSNLKTAHAALSEFQKTAFMAAPPMPAPGGGAPPMDPAMMDPAMMGGAPPMDPATGGGMPMDPAMMGGGGMPPMDPAMMDPAMAGGMPPEGAPPEGGVPVTPEMLDQILGLLEGMGGSMEALSSQIAQQETALQEFGNALEELDKRLGSVAATAPEPAADWS